MSAIQKVEIVSPVHVGLPKTETIAKYIVALLIALPLKTLFVFWFVASWFPELGLTYWQLLLPVYIASGLFQPLLNFKGRFIPKERLWKSRETIVDYDTDTVSHRDTLTELAKPKQSIKV